MLRNSGNENCRRRTGPVEPKISFCHPNRTAFVPKERALPCHSRLFLRVRPSSFTKMIDDTDLGFFANFLGISIFVLLVAYHYVVAEPKVKAL